MSICIAAVCDNLKTIVAVSDHMTTLLHGAMTTDGAMLKALSLVPGRWAAMFAGDDVSHATPILKAAREKLAACHEKRGEPTVVAAALQGAYRDVRSTYAVDLILGTYGMSMTEFLSNGDNIFGEAGFSVLRERLETVDVGCEFLAFGFDDDQKAHLFTVEHPGVVRYQDPLGYWAIGSGAYAALGSLAMREQSALRSVGATVVQACEAKFAAERAVGVGKRTQVNIVRPDAALVHLGGSHIDALRAELVRLHPPVPASLITQVAEWIEPALGIASAIRKGDDSAALTTMDQDEASREVRLSLPGSTRDPSDQPPSPGSRGESDES